MVKTFIMGYRIKFNLLLISSRAKYINKVKENKRGNEKLSEHNSEILIRWQGGAVHFLFKFIDFIGLE